MDRMLESSRGKTRSWPTDYNDLADTHERTQRRINSRDVARLNVRSTALCVAASALGIAATGVASVVAVLVLAFAPVASAAGTATVVSVTAGKPSEFAFKLSKKSVPTGAVTFKVVNRGALAHTFKICTRGGTANTCSGKVTKLLSPGRSATLIYTFKKRGTYEYLCTVPGHAAAGMKGVLRVT